MGAAGNHCAHEQAHEHWLGHFAPPSQRLQSVRSHSDGLRTRLERLQDITAGHIEGIMMQSRPLTARYYFGCCIWETAREGGG